VAIYKIWIHDEEGRLKRDGSSFSTRKEDDARFYFAQQVLAKKLDGENLFVAISCDGKVFARHWFMKKSGIFFLRDKLLQVKWPEVAKVGRPKEMRSGRNVTIYLNAEAFDKAWVIGNGNVSAGIRTALKNF